jgi:outer membrane immunogenic protein
MLHLGDIIPVRNQILIGQQGHDGSNPEKVTIRPKARIAGRRSIQERHMKRVLFAGAVALSAVAPALAADLPAAPPPQAPAAYVPVVAPEYNWSGIYIGINGGYAFGSTDWSSSGGFVGTGTFNTSGGLVGGTAGVNFQSGQIVFGIEGDWDWADISGTSTNTTSTFAGCGFAGAAACSFQTSSNWLATVRGRVGYAFDRVMIYATGGGAAGDVKATFTNPNTPFTGTTNSTEWGWTAGAGVEAALTDNITARVEYLYVDLQNGDCDSTICGVVPSVPVSFDASLVRAGVDFKFNPY